MSTTPVTRWVALALFVSAYASGCGVPPPTPAASDGSQLPPTPAEFVTGEGLYDASCAVCHDSSRDGSPRLGFLRAWRDRIEQGEATLVQHAIDGIGLMPPRGEHPELTDDQITEIVCYMVYRARLDIPARH